MLHETFDLNNINTTDYEILDLTCEEDELLASLDFSDGAIYHTAEDHELMDEYFGLITDGVDDSTEGLLDGLHIENPSEYEY